MKKLVDAIVGPEKPEVHVKVNRGGFVLVALIGMGACSGVLLRRKMKK